MGIFNPGVIEMPNGSILLLVRVAEQPPQVAGQVALPYWQLGVGPNADWQPQEQWTWVDRRVLQRRDDGSVRLSSVSHVRIIEYAADGLTRRGEVARLVPQEPWELFGVEDPRVTDIQGTYYLTYVAVSPWGVCTAWATSSDGLHWQRQGILFPPDNKDVVLFPELRDGRFTALHRPMPSVRWSPPGIWISRSPDIRYWGEHYPVYGGGQTDWQKDRVGVGPPPLRWNGNWLVFYHGSSRAARGEVGTYCAGALVLDGADPRRVIAHTPQPLLGPRESFECSGFVPNVIFPTGCIRRHDRFLLYYGAADTYTAVAELPLEDISAALRPYVLSREEQPTAGCNILDISR